MWTDGITVGEVLAGNGWYISTQISAPLNSGDTLPDGVYTVSNYTDAGYALTGTYGSSGVEGTWVREIADDAIKTAAPLTSGTVTVSNNNGTCTIEINAGDDAGNSITGTATGVVTKLSSNSASYGLPYKPAATKHMMQKGK
jgi:hypothetical protein